MVTSVRHGVRSMLDRTEEGVATLTFDQIYNVAEHTERVRLCYRGQDIEHLAMEIEGWSALGVPIEIIVRPCRSLTQRVTDVQGWVRDMIDYLRSLFNDVRHLTIVEASDI